MRTSGQASKIENSPAHVGYRMCETVPQATPRQTQEVVVGWVVDWRVSMLMATCPRTMWPVSNRAKSRVCLDVC